MRKIYSLLLVSALIITLMSACGSNNAGSGKNGEAAGTAEPKEVTLRMTVLPADLDTFQEVYENFHKENPSITVKIDTIPQAQYYEKLRLQLSSGEDISVFAGNMDVLLDTGILEPLDGYIKENKVDVSGFGPLYESLQVKNESFGLPYRKSNWMLYYNKTLFDQMKVDYPKADMTWDEFRELAKQMTKGEGADKVYGAFLQPWAQTWYLQTVQTGSSIIDKDLTPFVKGLQFRMDLEKDGSIMPWMEQITTSAHYNSAFQKGNVAMNLIGDWHVAQLREAEDEKKIDFDWDVVPIPHPEGVPANTSVAAPVSLMMNKNTKNKEAAFKLIEYMTGAKGANLFASKGFLTGYTNDEIKKTYIGDGSRKPEHIQYFVEQKEYPEYPFLPGVKNILVNGAYKQEGELALVGEQTAEQAIAKIAERVQKEWADKYEKEYQTK